MTRTADAESKHMKFAERLELASEANPNVPPLRYGRLTWFVEQFRVRFGVEVSIETVRKWFAGETTPRKERFEMLAEVLHVDPEYLMFGRSSDMLDKVRHAHNLAISGIVNVAVGIIEMGGGRPTFPGDHDEKARRGKIDFYAVIKGAHYAFNVNVCEKAGDSWRVSVPTTALHETVILAARLLSEFSFEFIELDSDAVIEHGVRMGEFYRVSVPSNLDGSPWRKIKTFAERL